MSVAHQTPLRPSANSDPSMRYLVALGVVAIEHATPDATAAWICTNWVCGPDLAQIEAAAAHACNGIAAILVACRRQFNLTTGAHTNGTHSA